MKIETISKLREFCENNKLILKFNYKKQLVFIKKTWWDNWIILDFNNMIYTQIKHGSYRKIINELLNVEFKTKYYGEKRK